MSFDLEFTCVDESSKKGGSILTSRMARKKDSILPVENPRAGAVCKRTAPILLHEGYARWNMAVASAPARRRSNVRCEDLQHSNVQITSQTGKIQVAHGGISTEIRIMNVHVPIGTREKGLRRVLSNREVGSTGC
jgi:hypothetical protein